MYNDLSSPEKRPNTGFPKNILRKPVLPSFKFLEKACIDFLNVSSGEKVNKGSKSQKTNVEILPNANKDRSPAGHRRLIFLWKDQ